MVVGMGHTSECGVVVASVGAPHGPYSVVAVRQRRIGDGGVDAVVSSCQKKIPKKSVLT